MLIENKEFKMKDGRTAILRSPREDDAPGLLEFLRVSAGETNFLIRYPEECNLTEEQEREWIRNARESDNVCNITCEVDGKIAGNCEVSFSKRIKLAHRGTIGIALLQDCCSQGIGTAMFEELICIARAREGISLLELEFVEGNKRAQALYEKMGFHIVSFKPNAIRLKDGTLLKEYYMQKEL